MPSKNGGQPLCQSQNLEEDLPNFYFYLFKQIGLLRHNVNENLLINSYSNLSICFYYINIRALSWICMFKNWTSYLENFLNNNSKIQF